MNEDKQDSENKDKKGKENIEKLKNEKDEVKEESPKTPIMKSPLMQIKQLIKVLSMPLYDGRVMLNIDPNRSFLKFILLNPSACFEEIISQARSVILAGGTMKPVKIYLSYIIQMYIVIILN